MDKTYSPQQWEDKIYEKWEKSGYFNPDNLNLAEDAPKYSMVLPPPNITDKLHIGHASVISIEDLFIRYHRMNGYQTLWIPGTDHAAIATQNVVEKKILKEEGKTRHDLGREAFLNKVWDFLNETQATILKQTRKIGSSIDWSRTAFTLDKARQKAVRKMFSDMYKEGVIYRGERVINWCPRCHSTLADDELEYQEQETQLYTFKYDSDFPIAISTTRPETKLGDTAVAVNPNDGRYKKYLDQEISANFCGQKLNIKIIADHNVDPGFGTGALGITPAHSIIDSQIAQKNNLPSIKVINEEGKIREGFAKFSNKTALEARQMIIKNLEENSLLIKTEEIKNNLSLCYRCNNAIEPLPSKQWFVDVNKKIERLGGQSLKEKAILAVENENIKFIPERFTKRYLDWMNNLHDWCISRQIWFGHQIPVWYKGEDVYVGTEDPEGDAWRQDPDTLDTWFSSGMWTFSTLGWPEKTVELEKFHPTQMLETGYELITLWISRMIMMSFFALGEIPFEKVYLNGLILDKDGKKMSKSKGNGIDPLDMIDKFGTDALRISLLIGNTPGNDVRMSEDKIASNRNFINKLWNISRFIISNCDNFNDKYEEDSLSLSDKWILYRLNKLVEESKNLMKEYKFSLFGEKLRDFTWNDLADWYLETKKFEKNENNNKILIFILKNILKLWHPFIPFITETVWQKLEEKELLLISPWPQAQKLNYEEDEKKFNSLQDLIIAIRNTRSASKVDISKKIKALVFDSENNKIIKEQGHLIKNLKTGIAEISFIAPGSSLGENVTLVSTGGLEIYLLDLIDEEEKKIRLGKEEEKLKKIINILESKLTNQDFIEKAPADLVQKEQARLAEYQKELNKLLNS